VQNVSNTKGNVQAEILKKQTKELYKTAIFCNHSMFFLNISPRRFSLWLKHFAELNTTDNIVVLKALYSLFCKLHNGMMNLRL
jgi:hypothetical protein